MTPEETENITEQNFHQGIFALDPEQMLEVLEVYQKGVYSTIEGLRKSTPRTELGEIALSAIEYLYTGVSSAIIWISHHHNLEDDEPPLDKKTFTVVDQADDQL